MCGLVGCAGSEKEEVLRDDLAAPSSSPAVACSLSPEEQALLDETNRMRRQGVDCGVKNFPKTTPVEWDCRLAAAAELHTRDMAKFRFLEHTGSDGLSLHDRLIVQGYEPQAWGENIAEGQTSAIEVVAAWVASAGHCRNLMSTDYQQLGAAVFAAQNGTLYWTQNFAKPH